MLGGKRIVVTGGMSGFLGTNFAIETVKCGANVYATCSGSGVRPYYIEQHPRYLRGIKTYTQDLRGPVALPDNIDYVFHCAAHTSGAHEMVHNPMAQVISNVQINMNLLTAAMAQGVKKFVFISSSAVYPDVTYALMEEDGFVSDPPDVYFGPAWMKRFSEKLAEFCSRQSDMEVLVIRPSNVYGPYSDFDPLRAHVLPALMRRFLEKEDPLEVWGIADVSRDFIFVSDFIAGVLLAFDEFSGFDTYNVASGEQVTIGECVNIIAELTNYEGTIIFNPNKPMTVRERTIDVSKIKGLGFRPRVSIKLGLLKLMGWYQTKDDAIWI